MQPNREGNGVLQMKDFFLGRRFNQVDLAFISTSGIFIDYMAAFITLLVGSFISTVLQERYK